MNLHVIINNPPKPPHVYIFDTEVEDPIGGQLADIFQNPHIRQPVSLTATFDNGETITWIPVRED